MNKSLEAIKTQYQSKFEALEKSSLLQCGENVMIVEPLPELEVTTDAGLIMPTNIKANARNFEDSISSNVPKFARVMMTGPSDEDNQFNPKRGNIVLLGEISVRRFSTFGLLKGYVPFSLGRALQSEIQMLIESDEKFLEIFEVMNNA